MTRNNAANRKAARRSSGFLGSNSRCTSLELSSARRVRHCRTLSGQRFPGMARRVGIDRTVQGIAQSLEYAEKCNVILCMENHYKDGNWQYPEFAQPEDIFLEIVGRIDSPYFGVQFDPSNAVVGGFDPVAFLEKIKTRVVTMHASDHRSEEHTSELQSL